MPTTKPKKRLNAEERREELLKAATEIFVKYGYEDTSLDLIIKKAGGSKRSIYTEFGGKKELFLAIINKIAGQILLSLPLPDPENSDLRSTLLTFAENALRVLFSPTSVKLFSMLYMDGVRFKELAGKYFEMGPDRAMDRLSEIFKQAERQGDVSLKDVNLAADHFISLLRGNLHMEVVLKRRPIPSEEQIENFAASAVDLFLNGIKIHL